MTSPPTAISVRDLHKAYKRTEALRGLDFDIPSGQVTGFLGPNGAGKTTTFRSLLGLTRPDRGSIEILGHVIPSELNTVTKKVGAIVEEPGLMKAHTGRVNLRIAADTLGFGEERIDEMLEFVGLEADGGRRVDEYSKGMRQRLALAAAMLGDPQLLLLDEPLDGLDPAGQHAFKARLRALADQGRTVVVSSHDLSDIEALADYVIVVDRGRLVSQGPLELLLGEGAIRVAVGNVTDAERLLSRAGFASRRDDGDLLVEGDDGSAIIRVLANGGVYPSEVRSARSSLETLFLEITGEGDG
jgi:ABC-2 type transport system ATP-binding protein